VSPEGAGGDSLELVEILIVSLNDHVEALDVPNKVLTSLRELGVFIGGTLSWRRRV